MLHESRGIKIKNRSKFVALCEEGKKEPSFYRVRYAYTITVIGPTRTITVEEYNEYMAKKR